MVATPLDGSYDGLAPFIYPTAGKPLQTYYRVFGNLNSDITPLVILHGGPGFCHNYLLNHSYLTVTNSIPVIFYDQLGSGLSTHLRETACPPEENVFWTEEIFFEQLRQLLNHLGIEKRYDILGSSWGGMMGSAFASKKPGGLRRLILANAPSSKKASIVNRNIYRKRLPKDMQGVLDRTEEAGTWDSKEVGVVMTEFVRRHICNVVPPGEDTSASVRLSNDDRTVADTMGDNKNGNSFERTGYFQDWTIAGRAGNISVPTLLIVGIDEPASGDSVKPFLDEIPDIKFIELEGTTHSPHVENKEEYMKIVADFLTAP